MPKWKDISNQRFGKLLTIEMIRVPEKTAIFFRCKCDCGNETITRSNALLEGRSTSCGCNTNQSEVLKFKKENPNATQIEIMKVRIKSKTKWVGECLEWTSNTSNGYGVFVHNRKVINASRAAWISENGEIPKGLCVLHRCDNRRCCRVSHMFLGTHQENCDDMIAKGRDRFQTCRKYPREVETKVIELRKTGMTQIKIAEYLGLSRGIVNNYLVRNRKYERRKNQ